MSQTPELMIRLETFEDLRAIDAVHREAFPTPAEAELVERLRADGEAVFSLVALQDRQVLGHAMFSRMQTPPGGLGLGPVAVLKAHREKGIAALLIRAGLQRATESGWKAVFVLGGEYYRRFGFDPRHTTGLRSPYAGPHLMGLALDPSWRPVPDSTLEYARAFALLG